MPGVGDFLGSSAANDGAEQLFIWGVLYGVLSSIFQPALTVIQQEAWKVTVNEAGRRELTPDELATMVVRGWTDLATAQEAAKASGVDNNWFANMVNNRRNPIPPEEAAVALRRNVIPVDAPPGQVSFNNAVQEGNLGDQWGPVIQELAKVIPTPADILQATLEGQIPAGLDAQTLYEAVGGLAVDTHNNINWFDFMFNTRGSAPTPAEAGVMARRGVIPWGDGVDGDPLIEGPGAISFHQAFLEGPWRNKWEPAFKAITNYLPPPRTVVAMLRAGALSVAQATDLLSKQGLTPDLVAAYIANATSGRTSTPKQLNVNTIEQLFLDKAIDQPTATTQLTALGYTASEAALLLESATLRQTVADLNRNTTRIAGYYIAHKIDRATATTMLSALGLPADQSAALLAGWDIDRQANVRRLTPAQITSGWEFEIFTQDEAQASLEADGYTPFDAWALLSIKNKAALPNPPPQGPPPVQ